MPHPTPLRVASALGSSAFPPLWMDPWGMLPRDVLEHSLSREQMETVVYATQSHETQLPEMVDPTGKRMAMRRAFLLGDAAGVGKGRQIGATILATLLAGKARKGVWVSREACSRRGGGGARAAVG